MSDAEQRAPEPWRDPIVVYSVSLLIVAALSFYGGFRWGVDRKATTDYQVGLAMGRACVEYVTSLQPRKVSLTAPVWIGRNCGRIADRSMEKINGMRTGVVR